MNFLLPVYVSLILRIEFTFKMKGTYPFSLERHTQDDNVVAWLNVWM